MDILDLPESFQNAACFELVEQSAFKIDSGRILGANWEGFGGWRLPPRTRLGVVTMPIGEIEGLRVA